MSEQREVPIEEAWKQEVMRLTREALKVLGEAGGQPVEPQKREGVVVAIEGLRVQFANMPWVQGRKELDPDAFRQEVFQLAKQWIERA